LLVNYCLVARHYRDIIAEQSTERTCIASNNKVAILNVQTHGVIVGLVLSCHLYVCAGRCGWCAV